MIVLLKVSNSQLPFFPKKCTIKNYSYLRAV